MESRYGIYSKGSSGWTSMKNEEFQEEDVWGIFKESRDSDSRIITSSFKEPSIISKRLPSATRMIPKSSHKTQEPQIIQHSAPQNIPDWSKIYGTSSKNSRHPNPDDDRDNHHHGSRESSWESEDEYQEDGEGLAVPPHEWIARRLARSQISSFSVCEGAGRTLKGRDLSRVRNAVLIKTGFLESKSD